jgi:hypothetical protein
MQQRNFSDINASSSITDLDEMKVGNEEQVSRMVPPGPAKGKTVMKSV